MNGSIKDTIIYPGVGLNGSIVLFTTQIALAI